MAIDEAKVLEIKAKLEERDNLIREAWVKSMEVRLVRNELGKCHQAEGVNHYENCKWLADKYLGMLRETKNKGYKIIDV